MNTDFIRFTSTMRKLGIFVKAAECRQKVCSSKRPPKLERRSVRPNEVFETFAYRIALKNRELVSRQKCSRKECSSKRPHHFP